MAAGSKRFKGGAILGSSLIGFLFCELLGGLVSAGLSSIKRTGSPVEVNIFGGAIWMGGRVEFGAEWVGFEVGVFGNRRLVFPVGAPRFRSFLGVELNCGGVGVVARFGLATPEPMIGLEFAVGGEAGGCLELAKRIEPTSA